MNLAWMVTRGSGFVAFGLLAASAILGLLVSSKLLGRSMSPKRITLLHESASIGALLATGTHMTALVLDDYVDFGVRSLLVPGASNWAPQAVAYGVVAMWGALIVTASFYLRSRIGRTAWRALHFGSFGVFVAALIHGVAAGTDSGNPAALALYVSAGTAVGVLMVARVVLLGARRAPRPAPGRPVPAPE